MDLSAAVKAATSTQRKGVVAKGVGGPQAKSRALAKRGRSPDVHPSRKNFMVTLGSAESAGSLEHEGKRQRNTSFTFQAVRDIVASQTLAENQTM